MFKKISISILFTMLTLLGFSQFKFGETYASKSEDGATKYLKVYEDGLVLMVATKDEFSKVQEYFHRDLEEKDFIILYRSQSKIKDGMKASFVLDKDGNKINCIAHGQGEKISLVMLSPNMGKQETIFTLVK